MRLLKISAGHIDHGRLSVVYDYSAASSMQHAHHLSPLCQFALHITNYAKTGSIAQAEPARVNSALPPESPPCLESLDCIPDFLSLPVDELLCHLDKSVMLRVRGIPLAQ